MSSTAQVAGNAKLNKRKSDFIKVMYDQTRLECFCTT